jgi:hypothetical protein
MQGVAALSAIPGISKPENGIGWHTPCKASHETNIGEAITYAKHKTQKLQSGLSRGQGLNKHESCDGNAAAECVWGSAIHCTRFAVEPGGIEKDPRILARV